MELFIGLILLLFLGLFVMMSLPTDMYDVSSVEQPKTHPHRPTSDS